MKLSKSSVLAFEGLNTGVGEMKRESHADK
jgi:hypothetical protein